jgi:hypothetical protein
VCVYVKKDESVESCIIAESAGLVLRKPRFISIFQPLLLKHVVIQSTRLQETYSYPEYPWSEYWVQEH